MSEDTHQNIARRIAELEIATAVEFRQRALEQHASAFKWLLASLLAVNGGGAIAIVQSQIVDGQARVWACGCFLFGVGMSLISSLLSQRLNISGLPALQKQLGFWAIVAETGNLETENLEALKTEFKGAVKWGWWVPAFGWFSAAAFIVGAVVVGFSLTQASVSEKRNPAGERSSVHSRHDSAGLN